MKREVEILKLGKHYEGNRQDGTPWHMTDVVVQWFEEGSNGRYEQTAVVSVPQNLDEALLNDAIKERTIIEVQIYFGVKEFNERFYNNLRCYLPREYEKKQ